MTHSASNRAKNLIIKNSTAPLNDTFLTARVKGAYLKAKVSGSKISYINTHIETKDSVVYLSGTLDNAKQISNAIFIAKNINGVKEVKSSLKIKKYILG